MKTPEQAESAWGVPSKYEARWPAQLAVVAAVTLQLLLPNRLTLGSHWVVPALELALLIPLTIITPMRHLREAPLTRAVALMLIAIVNVANVASLLLLVRALLAPQSKETGEELLISAVNIWLTNVIVFGLWYWELDRGGPVARSRAQHPKPDFLFPQMVTPACGPNWAPGFVDYLFVSFTNATAFSPTDTMPLTAWAKMLFLVQALISLLTVALVAARAVNILGS